MTIMASKQRQTAIAQAHQSFNQHLWLNIDYCLAHL
jgi:hypothetical protein